jgi:SAM-dependent methyltransferase/uncharacterized protein YbaR (Trm112 family)
MNSIMSPSTAPVATAGHAIDPWLLEHLACPVDSEELRPEGEALHCSRGHEYLVIDGVPILLHPQVSPEVDIVALRREVLEKLAVKPPLVEGVDPHVQRAVAATNGIMFEGLVGNLKEYPRPEIRLPAADGERLLDLGCNWGRWSLAATRKGYRAVGIDPSPEAVFAARRVSRQLGLTPTYVVGDARFIPFRPGSFDAIWSYSVLQHFSRPDFLRCLERAGRVLKEGGTAMIQMASAFGGRALYHQMRRGFKDGERFDVRYWTPGRLKAEFTRCIGPATVEVDGYFSLNPQPSEAYLLPRRYRAVISLSERLRRLSKRFPAMCYLADSLFIHACRR